VPSRFAHPDRGDERDLVVAVCRVDVDAEEGDVALLKDAGRVEELEVRDVAGQLGPRDDVLDVDLHAGVVGIGPRARVLVAFHHLHDVQVRVVPRRLLHQVLEVEQVVGALDQLEVGQAEAVEVVSAGPEDLLHVGRQQPVARSALRIEVVL